MLSVFYDFKKEYLFSVDEQSTLNGVRKEGIDKLNAANQMKVNFY